MAGSRIPPQAYTKEVLSKAFDWLKKQPDSVKDQAITADSLVHLYLQGQKKSLGKPTEQFELTFMSNKTSNPTKSVSPRVEDFKVDLRSLANQSLSQHDKDSKHDNTQESFELIKEENNYNHSIKKSDEQEVNLNSQQKPIEESLEIESFKASMSKKSEKIQNEKNKEPQKVKKTKVSKPKEVSTMNLFNLHDEDTEIDDELDFEESTNHRHQNTPPMQKRSQMLTKQRQENQLDYVTPDRDLTIPSEIIDSKTKLAVKEVQKMLNLSSEKEALKALVSIGYKQISQLFKM